MLQIKQISKQYKTGELVQHALQNVSLNFRENEFVSILGPSGSGKTTLLNIIGGLDRYDSGDLIINQVSTKNYKERDWDSYRNHTIGFVFQSYNLIPHQTILTNVELALTIGGISKKERKKRALDALEQVGLREQAHKRPNQMSGGQMQRVAIARALVNNPDILLADEPTGALDTETSVQVMELLKEVASDRLVIMVTHNPELAEEYSTRIVKLKDGKIIGDTNPFEVEEAQEAPVHKNLGKASMSILTALSLSFNNLLTKKGRTLLTAFAGSIGIIGIALILSLSTGFKRYIDQIQEEALTSYPLTITSETTDVASALLAMSTDDKEQDGGNIVEEKQYISTMFTNIGKNDLQALKAYLEEHQEQVDDMAKQVRYQYSVTPLVFTENVNHEITQLNPSTLLASMTGNSTLMMTGTAGASVFNEMTDDRALLKEQYDVLAGRWPEAYDETILVLSGPNEMPDLLVYSLGLRDSAELQEMLAKVMAGEVVEQTSAPMEFTYEELMQIPLKVVDASNTYRFNETYSIYESMTEDAEFMKQVYADALDLKIVGVVCAKKGENAASLMTGIAYTSDLTKYVIEQATQSEIVKKQLANPEINVFSNKRFDDDSQESGLTFEDMISIDTEMLSEAFGVNISESDITKMTQGYMGEISKAITADTSQAQKMFMDTLSNLSSAMLKQYIETNKDAVLGYAMIHLNDAGPAVEAYLKQEDSMTALKQMEAVYGIPADTFASMYAELIKGFLQGYIQMGPVDTTDPENPGAVLTEELVDPLVAGFVSQDAVKTTANTLAVNMTEAVMQRTILTKVGELSGELMGTMANAFHVDESKIAGAFQFDLSEEELMRLFETMSASGVEKNSETNLISLGYQDLAKPTSISFYFHDFESKEVFMEFLEEYNQKMEEVDEEKVIQYVDLTGILISSVKTIVDSVSYVLIAFVSISLIVSSIMIGIITYISVLERTKEIGVLRAIGASKRNISSIFNAETFIVGLGAGALGILISLLLLIPINAVIHTVTNNNDITAVLPTEGAIILVVLSVILTLIGGLIPSRQAAKKDPVLALRSE